MLASLPYGLFGWCGRSKKGKELKYHCSVLIFLLSVSLVMVVLALRHLSDTFGNPSACLKAAASLCFFLDRSHHRLPGGPKKVRARAPNQYIVLRVGHKCIFWSRSWW